MIEIYLNNIKTGDSANKNTSEVLKKVLLPTFFKTQSREILELVVECSKTIKCVLTRHYKHAIHLAMYVIFIVISCKANELLMTEEIMVTFQVQNMKKI